MPAPDTQDGDTGSFSPSAMFLLAAIEHLGWLSHEQAHGLVELVNTVVPWNYDSCVTTVSDLFGQMPIWDSCLQCRAELNQHKMRLVKWHQAQHPALEAST